MVEKGFVDALIKTIKAGHKKAKILKPSDNFTLGIPDILAWIPSPMPGSHPWSIAIEAKQLRPLMPDPFHKGRRTGKMLKHKFMGPQIRMLQELKDAGVEAFGLVRASSDTAFRIEPENLCTKTGNFTYEEMVEFGTTVVRENGVWKFWRTNASNISSSRHRDEREERASRDVGGGEEGSRGEGEAD